MKSIGRTYVRGYGVHIGFFFALVDESYSEAVLSVALRDGRQGVLRWIEDFPGEIIGGPQLKNGY